MPEPDNSVRTMARPTCVVCGSPGALVYSGLRDFSYAAPGRWSFRKCSEAGCGMVWLDPVPVPEDIGKAYEGYYTHHQPEPGASFIRDACWAVWHSYLGARFGYTQGVGPRWRRALAPLALLHPGGRDELDAAAMHLPAPRGSAHLLEIGSGSGVLLARMKAFGWQVEGIEVDPEAVKAARQRGVEVHLGDLQSKNFPDASFDAIHSAHVLEHLYDPAGLLKECHRILKPGGTLVVLTPNAESLGHRRYGQAWLGLDPPRHLNLFSLSALKRTSENAGFQVRRLESSIRIAWVCGALSEAIERTGRGEMSQLSNPLALLRGFRYQLRQRWAMRSDPAAGDELRLVATR
jgi:SAM-dependent methyltransferase